MKLTTHTDYALRTLMYLASREQRATIADVANVFGISANHVAKVVHLLAKHRFVRSIRGIGGGIELARPPQQIRLGDVVDRFEGSQHLLDCIGQEDVCVIQRFCKLKGVLAEAERIQREYLNSVTVADVAFTAGQVQSA